ncbi:glycosyltransferase [Rheinheimera soli]|uniref:Glycosyltransferase involved in cell wall biosynthesis n=1 Tax=Rheinheimera soli TaxID=443616 RepID=A0ABU1VV61_9GAMM|nr:glycosyltransferase [Rheinheimera soli]MDR7119313.1 glycosyltransferase involved in cell wall biosynthesis [Rheinheimera soli]
MDISVIVPSFNALGKLERCLASLRSQTYDSAHYEVLFVDDCSTDGTFAYLQKQAISEPNWRVLQLQNNSGSPSRPRNVGKSEARGEYIFYLDCDDEILPDTLTVHYLHAKSTDACIVRGYLIADTGNVQQPMNVIPEWLPELSRKERIEYIVCRQSTIPCSLIKKSLLDVNDIQWPEDIRMGEDSVFLCSVLAVAQNVEYINHPTYVYNQRSSFSLSSTQAYGARELSNHLQVWPLVQKILAESDINYFKLRLQKGLQAVLHSLIFRNKRDIDEQLFIRFSEFIFDNYQIIEQFTYGVRFKNIIKSLMDKNFLVFTQLTKPRLLIAGYDLKFIAPAIPLLFEYYDIQTDEWVGHDSHNEADSKIKLEWADYIWCEWLLGNAVWYSKNKLKHQKLIIRMHRFELGRDFGERLVLQNVDAVTAVSVLFFERLIERFPHIPRAKVKLLPNFVDIEGYHRSDYTASRFNIAMIGFVPSKKGYLEALKVLAALKLRDSRYCLKVFGKTPADIPWLINHPDELDYFKNCEMFITQHSLTDAIEYVGFVDIKQALAAHQVGFVLSLSEAVRDLPGFESFHLAVVDAYAAGAVGLIKNWTGCEYVYPESMILSDANELVEKIWQLSNDEKLYADIQNSSHKFIAEKFRVLNYLAAVSNLFREI